MDSKYFIYSVSYMDLENNTSMQPQKKGIFNYS
jgi:hypothetical protein